MRLDEAGLAYLHGPCKHRTDGRCPIEAAETAAALATGRKYVASTLVLFWAITAAVGVFLPHWDIYNPERGRFPIWGLLAMSTAFGTVEIIRTVPKTRQQEAEALHIARTGPTCDPWEVALSWDGRRPRSWPVKLRTRPLLFVACAATAIVVWLLTGSWLVALVGTGWTTYVGGMLGDYITRRRYPTCPHGKAMDS